MLHAKLEDQPPQKNRDGSQVQRTALLFGVQGSDGKPGGGWLELPFCEMRGFKHESSLVSHSRIRF